MRKNKIKTFFKDLSFTVVVSFTIGVAAGILVVLIHNFLNKVISDLAFGTGILAIATIILAFFTYLNIRSRSAQEKRDRKERQLKEVIDWAASILEAAEIEYSPEFMLKGFQTIKQEDQEFTLKAIYLREKQMYNRIRSKVEYIVNISERHLNKDDLGILNRVIGELKKQIKILDLAIDGKIKNHEATSKLIPVLCLGADLLIRSVTSSLPK